MRHAVILAGGSGTRLWPASRRTRPKQLLPLGAGDDESLLAATARRLAPLCPVERQIVVTAATQAVLVREALPGLPAQNLLAEPTGRNTAAAIGWAAAHLITRDPSAVMAVLPSDHHISDEARFVEACARAFAAAEKNDAIVTVGIVPTRPETAYGYLEVGDEVGDEVHAVSAFIEKPDSQAAARYLASGRHLWNAGMFFVTAARILRDIAEFLPDLAAGLDELRSAIAGSIDGDQAAVEQAVTRLYPGLPAISIDYGVMERARDVLTVPGDFGWNDVGSWSALADYRPADGHGNILQGTIVTHEATNNIVVADRELAVAIIGVDGLVVVQSGDGVLVVPRERAQEVRAAVAALAERGLDRFL